MLKLLKGAGIAIIIIIGCFVGSFLFGRSEVVLEQYKLVSVDPKSEVFSEYIDLIGKQDVSHVPLVYYHWKSGPPYAASIVVGTDVADFNKLTVKSAKLFTGEKEVDLLKGLERLSARFNEVNYDIYGGIGKYQAEVNFTDDINVEIGEAKKLNIKIVYEVDENLIREIRCIFNGKVVEKKGGYIDFMLGV